VQLAVTEHGHAPHATATSVPTSVFFVVGAGHATSPSCAMHVANGGALAPHDAHPHPGAGEQIRDGVVVNAFEWPTPAEVHVPPEAGGGLTSACLPNVPPIGSHAPLLPWTVIPVVVHCGGPVLSNIVGNETAPHPAFVTAHAPQVHDAAPLATGFVTTSLATSPSVHGARDPANATSCHPSGSVIPHALAGAVHGAFASTPPSVVAPSVGGGGGGGGAPSIGEGVSSGGTTSASSNEHAPATASSARPTPTRTTTRILEA
jgi:hypothetical protein